MGIGHGVTFLLKDIISRDFYCPPLYIVCIAKCEAVRLFIEEVLVSQRCSAHGFSAQCWSSHDSKFLIHIGAPGSSCNQQRS